MSAARAVWLVQGDDPVLIAEAVRTTIDELVGDADRGMVLEEFSGDEYDLSQVVDAAATPPFLADRRVVVAHEVSRFDAQALAPLLAYLEEPLDTSSLVLVAGGGRLSPKLNAAVKAHGHLVGTSVRGKGAKDYVRDRLRAADVDLDGPAARLVETHLGEDVSRLSGVLDVLAAVFPAGSRLGVDDVTPYLGDAGGVAPWDLTEAIDDGASELALTRLRRMLDGGDGRHPLVVLATLSRHTASLLRVDSPEIASEAAAAAAMGIAKGRSTFPAKKALASARRYGSAGIAEAVGLVADAEVALKGGRGTLPDEALVLEILVARLCRLARSRARR